VEQDDGESPVEQQNDLPRQFARGIIACSRRLEAGAQPVLDALLMRLADGDGRMTRQMHQFHRGSQEAAALPFGMPHRLAEIAEDALDLVGDVAIGLGEPALKERQIGLIADIEISRDQIVLAAKMIIERPLGDAGLFGHRIDADSADALAIEQLAGGFDDALTGGHGVAHGVLCIPTSGYTQSRHRTRDCG